MTTTYDPSTSTDCPVTTLRPALRAIDEREVAKHGPLVAVMKAKTQETLIRRAAMVLRRDDVTPADVATALGYWQLMHPGAVA